MSALPSTYRIPTLGLRYRAIRDLTEMLSARMSLNMMDDVASVYHFDAVPYTVLLYLTDVPREEGGALEIAPKPAPSGSRLDREGDRLWLAAGTLVLMDGTRCYHRAAPLLRPSVRLSIPLVYPNSEGTHERPAGLDSYSVRPGGLKGG